MSMLDVLLQDLRYGLRQLRRNPGFTTITVGMLALGIGALTAIFSLANALLLKPLPVPHPEQLVALTHGAAGQHDPSLSYPLFRNLIKESDRKGVDLFGFSGDTAQLSNETMQRKVAVQVVSGNFYTALRVQPQIGQLLQPENDRKNEPLRNTAVISNRLWHGAFHADAGVIGKKILLDKVPFVVIGVTSPLFFGIQAGSYPDITITVAGFALLTPRRAIFDCRNCNWMEVMGRLTPGMSASEAQAGLRVAWQRALRETVPENLPGRYRRDYFADQLFLDPSGSGPDSYLRNRFTRPLYVLLASALILLVACSNVANLLLVRTQIRHREIAVRLSAGATRQRIIQQVLTECVLLAIVGLAASTVVYGSCVRGLLWFMRSNGHDIVLDTTPDARMFGFIAATMTVTVLLFGLAPAVRGSRTSLRRNLADSAATITRGSRLSAGILAAEIALSLTLVTGAVLLARSLYGLRTLDAGFRRDQLLIASPGLGKEIPRAEDQLQFARRLLARLREFPGVRSVSASAITPVVSGLWMADFAADGYLARNQEDTACYLNFVSPHFFETMGTPFLLGRDFTPHDAQPGAPRLAIISQSVAKHFWPNQNPLGKQIHEVDKSERATVIGVVKDAKYRALRDEAPRTIYLQFPPPRIGTTWNFQLQIWTALNPGALASSVRSAFQRENPQVSVEIHTFHELLGRHLLYERLLTAIAISFGSLGLLMTAMGVYAVAAYSVSRRTMEIGIRVALGATKQQVVKLFVRDYSLVTCVGITVGVFTALGLTQFLHAWLFGVSSRDVPSLAVSVFLLAGVSVAATLIPTARALRAEPLHLLRGE